MLHRVDRSYRGIEMMVHKRRLRTRRILADHQCDRAMRIDMIGSVLGIVFHHEDGRIIPVRAMRYSFHHASDRKVVICNRGPRGRPAHSRSAGVVVGQVELNELRQSFVGTTSSYKLVEFAEEFVGAKLVGIVNREIRIEGINVIALRLLGWPGTFQPGNGPRPWTWAAARIPDIRRQRLSPLNFSGWTHAGRR